jgi:hypothetical protein
MIVMMIILMDMMIKMLNFEHVKAVAVVGYENDDMRRTLQ